MTRAAQGKEAARIAVTMLNAPQCPAGIMPVVIDNGFGGSSSRGLRPQPEATSVGRGNSVFCGKLGQKIASDVVTAVDDGTPARRVGQPEHRRRGPAHRPQRAHRERYPQELSDRPAGLPPAEPAHDWLGSARELSVRPPPPA